MEASQTVFPDCFIFFGYAKNQYYKYYARSLGDQSDDLGHMLGNIFGGSLVKLMFLGIINS
ncbi:hypothetical protein PPNK14_08320 [Pectobacterium parmentieri]